MRNFGLESLLNALTVIDKKLSILLARSFITLLPVEHGLQIKKLNWQNSFNGTGRNGPILGALSTGTPRIFETVTVTTLSAARTSERILGMKKKRLALLSTSLSL